LVLRLSSDELAVLIINGLIEQDEDFKKELISKNDENELKRVFHTTRSFAKEYSYPESEVINIIDKFITSRGLNFFEQISISENGHKRNIGPYHIGPSVSKYLLENEFCKISQLNISKKVDICINDISNKFNIPFEILRHDLFVFLFPKWKEIPRKRPEPILNKIEIIDEDKIPLIEDFCSQYLSIEEFATKYGFPIVDVTIALQSDHSLFYPTNRYLKYLTQEKTLSPERLKWLLNEAVMWKSVKELSKMYGVSVKKVINVLNIEKDRRVSTYHRTGTDENSYVISSNMLQMLNNFFIYNDVPIHHKKSPLDSSVGYGNTPNSRMGKSLTKDWPRFL